jgi:hypothetical protein
LAPANKVLAIRRGCGCHVSIIPRAHQRRWNPPLMRGLAFDSPYPYSGLRLWRKTPCAATRCAGWCLVEATARPWSTFCRCHRPCPHRLAWRRRAIWARWRIGHGPAPGSQKAKRYIRDGSLFRENSAGKLGL